MEGNKSYAERKFQGTKELSLLGTKVPPYGTFVPGSEISWERKFQRSSVKQDNIGKEYDTHPYVCEPAAELFRRRLKGLNLWFQIVSPVSYTLSHATG